MPFKFRRESNDLIVRISGALTFHQHAEGEQLVYQITQLVDEGEVTRVRIDFSGVTRMDSHWLGVMIRVLRRAREKNAEFIIEKPGLNIKRLFEMVELNRIAEIRT